MSPSDPYLARSQRLYALVGDIVPAALARIAADGAGRPNARQTMMLWAVPVAVALSLAGRLAWLPQAQLRAFVFDQANLLAYQRLQAPTEDDPIATFRSLVDHIGPYAGTAITHGADARYIERAVQDFLRSSAFHSAAWYGRDAAIAKPRFETHLGALFAESLRGVLDAISADLPEAEGEVRR